MKDDIEFPETGFNVQAITDGRRLIVAEPLTESLISSVGTLKDKVVELWALWRNQVGYLDLLQEFPALIRLHIINRTTARLVAVQKLKKLRILTVDSDAAFDLDMLAWPILEELAADWRGKWVNLHAASSLKVMRIGSWKEEDCARLRNVPGLISLELIGGRLRSLRGLEACSQLRHLNLIRLAQLSDFSAVANCIHLRSVRIETCKKLHDTKVFSSLSELERLYLDNVGDVVSLKPLRCNARLRTLHFIESTNVLDGNTAIIRDMGIQDFSFQNRKHYNFNYSHSSC